MFARHLFIHLLISSATLFDWLFNNFQSANYKTLVQGRSKYKFKQTVKSIWNCWFFLSSNVSWPSKRFWGYYSRQGNEMKKDMFLSTLQHFKTGVHHFVLHTDERQYVTKVPPGDLLVRSLYSNMCQFIHQTMCYLGICIVQCVQNWFNFCLTTFRSHPEIQQSSSYSVDISFHPSNGHIENLSPNSTAHVSENPTGTLVSRTQKHQTTQQVGFQKQQKNLWKNCWV